MAFVLLVELALLTVACFHRMLRHAPILHTDNGWDEREKEREREEFS